MFQILFALSVVSEKLVARGDIKWENRPSIALYVALTLRHASRAVLFLYFISPRAARY